jgi:hypothetical protein
MATKYTNAEVAEIIEQFPNALEGGGIGMISRRSRSLTLS